MSLYQRIPGFPSHSFYLDDLWVAVLVKSASLPYIFEVKAPSSPGFLIFLKFIQACFGNGEWQLQIVPLIASLIHLIASLIQIVLIGFAVYRVSGNHILGLVGSTLLAANSNLAIICYKK